MKKKIALSIAAIALVICCAVGGTLAWLTDRTASVTNTFTVGNIDITLDETTGNSYKMVPGNTIAKDPKVTVVAGSEACWLFVKVEKSANFDSFMTYTIASGWTALTGVDGVYYREVDASTAAQVFNVLTDNQVTVKDTVTKAMMDNLTSSGAILPTLTFTAYAVQKAGFTTVAAAWAEASK